MRLDLATTAYGLEKPVKLPNPKPHSKRALATYIRTHGLPIFRFMPVSTYLRVNRYVRFDRHLASSDWAALSVYGNTIMEIGTDVIRIRTTGWPTNTTCDWLRACGVPLYKRQRTLYVADGIEIPEQTWLYNQLVNDQPTEIWV